MDWHRIVAGAIDAASRHSLQHTVAILNAHGIDVINMRVVSADDGPDDARLVGQQFIVEAGMHPAGFVRGCETAQFHAQYSALDTIHPRVPTDHRMQILCSLAMI